MWSFTANAGDNLALRVGAPDFRPNLNLYGPSGNLIATANGSASGHHDASIFVQATNSGTFTVVEQSFLQQRNGTIHAQLRPLSVGGGDISW
ncbi:MAG: hypothetical protein WDN00_15670 [Limisphaerales bacterium]